MSLYYTLSHQNSGFFVYERVDRLYEPEVVNIFKETTFFQTQQVRIHSMHAGRHAWAKARKNPSMEKGKWIQSPAPRQEAINKQ